MTDFGSAKLSLANLKKSDTVSIAGTGLYLSPLLYSGDGFVAHHNLQKSEVFSLGLSILQALLLLNEEQIKGLNDAKNNGEVKIKNYLNDIPKEFSIIKEILFCMLQFDEKNRIDFQTLYDWVYQ